MKIKFYWIFEKIDVKNVDHFVVEEKIKVLLRGHQNQKYKKKIIPQKNKIKLLLLY